MIDDTVYQGDYGHHIRIYINNSNISVSDVVLAKLKVLKPISNNVVEWTLNNATDEDGNPCLQYITVEGNFDEYGDYKFQVYLETQQGFHGHVKMFVIPVKRTIG